MHIAVHVCNVHSAVHRCQLFFHSAMHILEPMAKKKNAAAVALGRKGGKNSRKNLTPEERTALAQKAAAARWKGSKGEKPANVE